MNLIKRIILRWWYKSPENMEMVSYWKTARAVKAKVVKAPEGHYHMWMEGEKYPFPGFPRGSLLFGQLSKVKHQIKNFIFNDSWKALEDGSKNEDVVKAIRTKGLDLISQLAEECRFVTLPANRMAPAVRELHRALSVIEGKSKRFRALKEVLCFILQEDDAYRFRWQWLCEYFKPNWLTRLLGIDPLKAFKLALEMLEHAEVVGDMKERIRLLRRIVLLVLEDEEIKTLFDKMCKEVDWNKVKLSKADKFFFRAKWFKVDYKIFEY